MYLAISLLGLAVGLAGAAFGVWQRRRTQVLQNQLLAFHAAGLEKDEQLKKALALAEKWQNAAETARRNALLEVENLLNYNGTGEGQHEITE